MKAQTIHWKSTQTGSSPETQPSAQTGNFFNKLWEHLQYLLVSMAPNGYEPRIWCTQNRYGEIWWHVYNPINGQTVHLASEDEVRMWLDQQPGISL